MTELSANAIIYVPDKKPYAGVIQIIHGMAEHQGRHRELAQFFCDHGYVVLTSDLRGHGNHIARDTDLGYFGDNAVSRLVSDIHDNTAYIRNQFPNLPYFLFGHGIGALLAVIYIKKYDNFIDGLFLSGMPADRLWPRRAMNLLLLLLMLLRGEYHRSSVINFLIMGQYYRPLIKEGSEFAWLSSDPSNVQKYEEDPKCGYIYTFNGFKTVLELMDQTYCKGSWIRKNTELPIRLFWGAKDPCMDDPNDLSKTVHLFSDIGYQNVAYISYPGQRHEVFHDYNKETACLDTLKEMETIRRQKGHDVPVPVKKRKHIILDNFVDPEVDKPLVKDEKLNLDEFIQAHKDASPASGQESHPKVEMIDFAQIDRMLEESIERETTASSDTAPASDAQEALSGEAGQKSPSETRRHTVSDIFSQVASSVNPDEPEPDETDETMEDSELSEATEATEAAETESTAETSEQTEEAPHPVSMDYDALIDELLNHETYTPGGRRPLDDFDGFKIDPDIMDGIH